jgi:hypothetical protein
VVTPRRRLLLSLPAPFPGCGCRVPPGRGLGL